MAPEYKSYDGYGKWAEENFHYSQAVRIGNVLKISGQGGWDPKSGPPEILSGIDAQIDRAFENVDLTLKTAGGKGWSQVYNVRSYHVFTDRTATTIAMVRNMAKWCPDHKPTWTAVGVTMLAVQGMEVEIEVEALVE